MTHEELITLIKSKRTQAKTELLKLIEKTYSEYDNKKVQLETEIYCYDYFIELLKGEE